MLPPRTLGLRDITILLPPPSASPTTTEPPSIMMMEVDHDDDQNENGGSSQRNPEGEGAALMGLLATGVSSEGGVETLELSCHHYYTLPSPPTTAAAANAEQAQQRLLLPLPSIHPVLFRALSLARGLRRLDLGTTSAGAGDGAGGMEEPLPLLSVGDAREVRE